MRNLENLDVFESLITQNLLKCPKDPFVRSALNYLIVFSGSSDCVNMQYTALSGAMIGSFPEIYL